jgi:hypothetical protein
VSLLTEFLERFLILSNAYKWTDDDTCRRFPLYLRGSALDVYLTLDPKVMEKWADLLLSFKKHYINNDSAKVSSREFRTRQQIPSETVDAYAYALRKLARKAYPMFDDKQLDIVLIDQFTIGLAPQLLAALWDKEFITFDQAVEKATSMEYRQKLLLTSFPVRSNAISSPPLILSSDREKITSTGDYFCDICKRTGHLTRSCKRLIENNNDRNLNNITCFKCRKLGHKANVCPELIPRTSVNVPTCYRCHLQGHKADVCPDRDRNVQHHNNPDRPLTTLHERKSVTCFRCRLLGHKADECNAKFDAAGVTLPPRWNNNHAAGHADNRSGQMGNDSFLEYLI